MLYFVSFDGDRDAPAISVDVLELPSGGLEARSHGRPIARAGAVLGRQRNQRLDRPGIDLTAEGSPPELGIVARDHRGYARVESERMRAAERAKRTTAPAHEHIVRSPMPGRVVKVLVTEGDSVEAGQGLVVLEAMKMENEVRARAAGTVGEVHVVAGSTVEGNAKLLTFEARPASARREDFGEELDAPAR